MIPGRSLSGNATVRSSEPAANTAVRAAIRQKHSGGRPSTWAACRPTRSSAPNTPSS